MTIQERKYQDAGGGGGGWLTRVRVLPDGETMPDGAKEVPAETPLHEWKQEGVI